MDLKKHNSNLEAWFLSLKPEQFPGEEDYVAYYKSLKGKLSKVQKQVTQGADKTDGTSLTWHDQSHIDTVVKQVSDLISYKSAELTPFEVFLLLTSIQIHDVMNSDGREEHELRSIDILSILQIGGLVDSVTKNVIKNIVACHSGYYNRGDYKEKDKIGYLFQYEESLKGEKIRFQFLAALLRLADEYSDNEYRAMSYLLEMGKIQDLSEIHHKYAECLHSVMIGKDTGIVDFDFHIQIKDASRMFKKYDKEKQTEEMVYLIDEIFLRTLKSHYETIYCMRYLRPFVTITKLSIKIKVELSDITKPLSTKYELVEKGYPSGSYNIMDYCQDQLRLNGSYWSGYHIKEYIEKYKLT